MHTIKILVAGLLILSAVLLLANAWTTTRPVTGVAISIFLGVWAIISVLNLWIGVYRAGYSLSEELPILALVFLVPALAGVIVAWEVAIL
jgi:hypothetical protein